MESIFGGILIGIAVSIMLLFNGRVTGISGILGGLLSRDIKDKNWRIYFILGLISGGLILKFFYPMAFNYISHANNFDYIVAGFLVGFGTFLGNGCTSGHGICGISRLSIRSIFSTILFIFFGIISTGLFKFFRGQL